MKRKNMDEDIWRGIFESGIEDKGISDLWNLSVDEHFKTQAGWLQYSLCCFACFCCSICGRIWASSKVHVLFYIKLKSPFGQVKMHIFKQKCKICTTAEFQEPTFIVENIELVMKCLISRICQKFYNFPVEDFPRIFIKDGTQQDGPHDRDNCEACSMGICNRTRQEIKPKQTFACLDTTNTYNLGKPKVQQSIVATTSSYSQNEIQTQPRKLTYAEILKGPQSREVATQTYSHEEPQTQSRNEAGSNIYREDGAHNEQTSRNPLKCCCIIL